MNSEKNADILLKVIDDRCRKILNKSNVSTKIAAKVLEVTANNDKAIISISGDNNKFKLLNKTGEILKTGDNVFVENINGDLTNGFISEKFGSSNASKDLCLAFQDTNANNGALVSLPNADFYQMLTFEIIGNGYSTSMPFSTHIQGYHFQSLGYFVNCKQQNTSGTLPQCKFMIKNNKVALWIPNPRAIHLFDNKMLSCIWCL
jgi:hypothetical protein